MRGLEYRGLAKVDGPLVLAENRGNPFLGEMVRIRDRSGELRHGRVVDASERAVAIQVFGPTIGLSLDDAGVEYSGDRLRLRVGGDLLGRVFNGLGEPVDGHPDGFGQERMDINGEAINPWARVYPRDFIQTGISAIDGMNTLIRGQKLPLFSGNGLPHNRLMAQIIRQARLRRDDQGFALVFAAMGVKYDVARYFIDTFTQSGALSRVALFLSLADAPSIERLVTPRCALTAAEHLAWRCGMHVLVVMGDMTNYCESLREIATVRGEVPSRKGYPGYLYSDLASLYERAGRIRDSAGSITQIAMLTMPSDDISHPIPDLTGYITEGQIVLDRELFQRGIYPPIAGLPSLSRLMKDGIGAGMTREDHPGLASQLFAAYAKARQVRELASIIGEEELSVLDKRYLRFAERFETGFLAQSETEDRSIETTLDQGWQALACLPAEELLRLSPESLAAHLPAESPQSGGGHG